jgi:predicted secreted protein
MPYTGSKAQTGAGSTLSIGTTPTPIGEIKSAGITGAQWSTVDVTNFESGVNQEFISTIRNNGSVKMAGSRVSSDAGQVLVEAAFSSGLIQPFVLVLDKTPAQTTLGDTYTFNALVESRDFDVTVDKEVSWSVSLKISGAVTFTVGS